MAEIAYGLDRTLALVMIASFVPASLVAAYLWFRRQRDRQLLGKLDLAIDRHIDTLVRVRAESIRYDENGRLQSPEWQQEIERFLDSQLTATLTRREIALLQERRAALTARVARCVAAGVARSPIYQ